MDAQEALSAQVEMARARLEEVREARGWTLSNIQQMTGLPGRVTAARWWFRAPHSKGLRRLAGYAHELGYAIRLLIVKDDPAERPLPWRERMPHAEYTTPDPDADAMAEPRRLQDKLRRARVAAGRSRADVAEALGTSPIHVWCLEYSPTAHDSALCDFLMYARFLGYTIRLDLAPDEEKGSAPAESGEEKLSLTAR
jgi:transcriptional regulator with XRE-family HTH domain